VTYATLTSLLQDELENHESTFVSNIPNIVEIAESKIYGRVRTPDQRDSSTSSFGIGVNSILIAANGIEPISFTHSNGIPLDLKDESLIRVMWGATQGTPVHYAIQSATAATTTILVGPTPSSVQTWVFRYFKSPVSIVSASTTWLSVSFPDVLLNGCLIQASIYNKSEDIDFKRIKAEYEEGIAALIRSAEGLMTVEEARTGAISD